MRVALDRCVEKIEKQLKKQREKIRQHKPKTIRRAQEKPLNEEEIEEPTASKIMETRKVILKPMSFDEAIMEIEETNDRFVLYRDTSSENVSMIYRGDDGRYTLIETK